MASKLLCDQAYRKGKHDKIMCKVSGILCAHQFWCDISVEYKHFPAAAECPGKEEKDGEKPETGAFSTDKI